MALPPIIKLLPADHWIDRAGQPIVAIVAHGTGGTDSRATLQHGDGRGISIHVLIQKPGVIYRMVADERGANHAGAPTSSFMLSGHTYRGKAVNQATLGFELENLQDGRDPYTDPQLLAMGWQIATWRARYGNLPLLRHADLDPTRRRDPYQLSVETMERWSARAQAQMAPLPQPPRPYRVIGLPVYQREDRTGVVAGYVHEGTTVLIDDPTNGHLQNELGFIDMRGTEAL